MIELLYRNAAAVAVAFVVTGTVKYFVPLRDEAVVGVLVVTFVVALGLGWLIARRWGGTR